MTARCGGGCGSVYGGAWLTCRGPGGRKGREGGQVAGFGERETRCGVRNTRR